MRLLSIVILMTVLLLPVYGNAEPVPPPDVPDCACNTIQIPDGGPTGNELLAEICPGGRLAPGGQLIVTETLLSVRLDDPRREFRTGTDTTNEPNSFCSITEAPETIGEFIDQEQYQMCRERIELACGLQTRPIPTVSEWGLIALAGALGLVGFIVIRRKKALA